MIIRARCPACSSPFDTYNGVNDADEPPCANSWAICMHCAEVLRVVRVDTATGQLTLRRTTLLERSGPQAPENLEHELRAVLARMPRRH